MGQAEVLWSSAPSLLVTGDLFERRNCLWYRLQTMSRRFFKSCGIVFLSMVILYSGVAWAVMACLDQDDHRAPVKRTLHHGDHLFDDSASPDPLAARLHCLDSRDQIGPMARTSPTQLVPFTDGAPLKDSPFSGSVTSGGTNEKDLWLRAFFEKFPSFAFLNGLSSYLFLAVLRI